MGRFHARPLSQTTIVLILLASSTTILAQVNRQVEDTHEPELVLVEQYPSPVVTVKSSGAEGNKYGFEGGNVVKLQGTYHLVTTEMVDDPFWVKTKLAHWSSTDRLHWKRVSTLFGSSGNFTGKDPRAALWGPMFVYDPQSQRWNLVYVAYRSAPNTPKEFLNDYDGNIWRAVSKVKGPAGIGGPFTDVGVLLQPGKDSQPWEGLLGTDSFFPYRMGDHWLGIYGSTYNAHRPGNFVGLAGANQLAGPWKRRAGTNPVNLGGFAENPIVSKLQDGSYLAVYDNNIPNTIGYTWSPDGIHWTLGRKLVVQPRGKGFWADDVRTPLGLVAEGHDLFTIFYTGYQKPLGSKGMGIAAIGFVTVKLQPHN